MCRFARKHAIKLCTREFNQRFQELIILNRTVITKMKTKQGYKLRKLCGSSIVVSVGKKSDEFNGLITLNESGELLWERLGSDADEDELVQLILNEYDVDRATAESDVHEFVRRAKAAGLLEE